MYTDPMLTNPHHHHGLHHAGGFADYHAAAAAYSTPLANQSDQEYQQTQSVMTDGGHQFPVAATCFDNHEELLWSGNTGVSDQKQTSIFSLKFVSGLTWR
jgi:hypothetical protein